jgi:hypothetical protein
MLALLVARREGCSRHISAGGGDWGIDVLVGELNGRVKIWQAKYRPNNIGRGELRRLLDSFDTACHNADRKHYAIEGWTLCVPVKLTKDAALEWNTWRTEQRAKYPDTTFLWDETALTSILIEEPMGDIRRHFYGFGSGGSRETAVDGDDGQPSLRLRTSIDGNASHDPAAWVGGTELLVGTRSYLLRDPVEIITAPDRSWTLRGATADEIEPTPRPTWIRQLLVHRDTPWTSFRSRCSSATRS